MSEEGEDRTDLAVKSEISSLVLSEETIGIVLSNIDMLTEGFKKWLVNEIDYTKTLFGRSDKPSLLDPGTAKIVNFFQVRPMHRILEHVLCTEEGDERVKYIVAAELVNPKTGFVVAEGIGSCSTDEVKYQYRWLTRSKLKNEQGLTDEEIDELPFRERTARSGGTFKVHRIRNPEILDLDNTMLKMASKRAEMDSALQLPGVGAVFTQDLGDGAPARKHVDSTQSGEPVQITSASGMEAYLRDNDLDPGLVEIVDEVGVLTMTPIKYLEDEWKPINNLVRRAGGSWEKVEGAKNYWRIPLAETPEEPPDEPLEKQPEEPPSEEEEKEFNPLAERAQLKSIEEVEYILDGKFPGANKLFAVTEDFNGFMIEPVINLEEEVLKEAKAFMWTLGAEYLDGSGQFGYTWIIKKGG